jgi:hypothetical protein
MNREIIPKLDVNEIQGTEVEMSFGKAICLTVVWVGVIYLGVYFLMAITN